MLFGSHLRELFPIFSNAKKSQGSELVYLDNAASTQKPQVVIDRISKYFSFEHANVHRGAYKLSAQATDNYEAVRIQIAKFFNVASADNIIFTKGTTDAINLAAFSLFDYFREGDFVLLTQLEHHSNIVPWQLLANRRGIKLAFVDINDSGELDYADFLQKLKELKPKLVSFSGLSNAIGTVTPLELIVSEAKKAQALVLVDAAQLVAHKRIDIKKLDCDFLAFSGHKLYGPTGCGVLFCSDRALDLMSPVQGGGEMIASVTVSGSTWAKAPHKFEAGTPAIAEIIALGDAISFTSELLEHGLEDFERKIFLSFFEALRAQDGIQFYGPGPESNKQASIISFNLEGVHPHDLASIADSFNVQLRAGHHCAQPLMSRMGLNASARISLACYSDLDQIEALISAISYAKKVFI